MTMSAIAMLFAVPALLVGGLVLTRSESRDSADNCTVVSIQKPSWFKGKDPAAVKTTCGVLYTDKNGALVDNLIIGQTYDFELRVLTVNGSTSRSILRATSEGARQTLWSN